MFISVWNKGKIPLQVGIITDAGSVGYVIAIPGLNVIKGVSLSEGETDDVKFLEETAEVSNYLEPVVHQVSFASKEEAVRGVRKLGPHVNILVMENEKLIVRSATSPNFPLKQSGYKWGIISYFTEKVISPIFVPPRGWTDGFYNPDTGQVTFESNDGLGFTTPDIRGSGWENGSYNPTTGQVTFVSEQGLTFQTEDIRGRGWSGGSFNPSTGIVTFTSDHGLQFQTTDIRGKGWTGASYSSSTGKVTFTSAHGLGFVTGDLRGTDGTDGKGWTAGSYNPATGRVVFSSADGLGFSTDDLRGTDGKGWTSGNYNTETGVITFASNDGLGFSTDDIRGADGRGWNGTSYDSMTGRITFTSAHGLGFTTVDLRGKGWNGGSYNASTGVVTFVSSEGLEFSTGDLRGKGWTGASYNATDGTVTFSSNDGLGFVTGDLRGRDGTGWTGGEYNPSTGIITFSSTQGLGFQTNDIRAKGWTGGAYDATTGRITFTSNDGLGFVTNDLRSKGWTGAAYNASTGVITFSSNDGLGFATGDLRGRGWTGVTYSTSTGKLTFASAQGLGYTTADIRGLGWTGVSYNPADGKITFASNQGLGYVTGDLRGKGWNGGSFDPSTGIVTFTSSDGLTFETGDLRAHITNITATEILDKLRTVDGANSGVDADLLDGYHASDFVLSQSMTSYALKAGDTFTGPITVPELQLEGGDHRISTNDGAGNFNIRVGNKVVGSTPQYTKSAQGAFTFNIEHEAATPSWSMRMAPTAGANAGANIAWDAASALVATLGGNLTYGGNKVWTQGNDGAGSGLDADLLHGVTGSTYARKDQGNIFNSVQHVQVAGNEQLRLGENTASGISPFISFYNQGARVGYLQAVVGASAAMRLVSEAGGILSVEGSGVVKVNNNLMWHASNDGAGSGLDADLLDGLDSVVFARKDQTNVLAAWQRIEAPGNEQLRLGENSAAGVSPALTFFNQSTRLALIQTSDTFFRLSRDGGAMLSLEGAGVVKVNSNLMWHAGNDGAGSGLDADLLDGNDSSYYASVTYVNSKVASLVNGAGTALDTLNELSAALANDPNFSTTMMNELALKLNRSEYTAADVLAKVKTVDGAGSGLDADLLDGVQGSNYARLDTTNEFGALVKINGGPNASELIRLGGGGAAGPYISFFGTTTRLGYIQSNATDTRLANEGGALLSLQGSGVAKLNDNLMWHAGNDGAGSGLDADMLDGQQGSYYRDLANSTGTLPDARLTGSYTGIGNISMIGNLTISNSGPVIKFIDTSTSEYSARLRVDSNNVYFDSSTDDVNFSEVFRFELDTKVGYVSGGKIWHSGNDGSGSALDADLLDGKHATAFADSADSIVAGNGLTGGGTLAASRTITLGTPGSITAASTNSVTATSHTHELSEATVRALISQGGAGELGTYAFLLSANTVAVNTNVAGSNLRYSNAEGSAGSTPTGTWKCMGASNVGSGYIGTRTTLWLRVA